MASGKTTIGKKLAKKLYYNFIDLDELIEEKEKCLLQIFLKKKEKSILEKLNINI